MVKLTNHLFGDVPLPPISNSFIIQNSHYSTLHPHLYTLHIKFSATTNFPTSISILFAHSPSTTKLPFPSSTPTNILAKFHNSPVRKLPISHSPQNSEFFEPSPIDRPAFPPPPHSLRPLIPSAPLILLAPLFPPPPYSLRPPYSPRPRQTPRSRYPPDLVLYIALVGLVALCWVSVDV